MQCYRCNTEIEVTGKPQRSETCPSCGAYLKCCRNCRFYDPKAYNECHEPQAERVMDKENANFCDYFEAAAQPRPIGGSRKDDARKKLNELFKKKG